jgi:hypothetical protein
VAVPDPLGLVAVRVTEVTPTVVGVPEIFEPLNVNPAGKADVL